jgi:hypothetical protein
MAGTVTATRAPRVSGNGREVEKVSVAWTSDASGNADGSITNLYGFLVKYVTDPDGTAAPTDLYDMTLVDENSVDALAGSGADRSATLNQQVYPVASGAQTPVFLCGTHTFTIANAGNAKSGVAVFYLVESL